MQQEIKFVKFPSNQLVAHIDEIYREIPGEHRFQDFDQSVQKFQHVSEQPLNLLYCISGMRARRLEAYIVSICFSFCGVMQYSLVPRPRPAFHRLNAVPSTTLNTYSWERSALNSKC